MRLPRCDPFASGSGMAYYMSVWRGIEVVRELDPDEECAILLWCPRILREGLRRAALDREGTVSGLLRQYAYEDPLVRSHLKQLRESGWVPTAGKKLRKAKERP